MVKTKPAHPVRYDLQAMTVTALKTLAKSEELKGYSKLNKQHLVELLTSCKVPPQTPGRHPAVTIPTCVILGYWDSHILTGIPRIDSITAFPSIEAGYQY